MGWEDVFAGMGGDGDKTVKTGEDGGDVCREAEICVKSDV